MISKFKYKSPPPPGILHKQLILFNFVFNFDLTITMVHLHTKIVDILAIVILCVARL